MGGLPSSCPSDSFDDVGSQCSTVASVLPYKELLCVLMFDEERCGVSIAVEWDAEAD